ncbi:MAG: thiol reductant ABC exporter subunit CydD [Chloroflexota bacterium]|jgi:ATP-binding cassette subfamily C protein CydD
MAAPAEQRLRQLNRGSQRLVLLASACGVAAALLFVGQALVLSQVVQLIFLDHRLLADVLPLLGMMLLFILGRAVFVWLTEILAQRSASQLKADLRRRLVAHLFHLGPAYTTAERSGELTNAIIAGVETLDEYIAHYLPARYLAMAVPALVFVVVLILDPWSTIVLLFAGPMLLLIMALIGGRTRAITQRRFAEMSWMSAFFLDMLQGLPTLKLYGRSREQSANILAISRQFGSTTMDVLRTAFQSSLVMEWAATAATAMVALETSLRLMSGTLPFNQALAVILLTPEFFLPLRQMAMKYHAGTQGKAAAERLLAILDTKPAWAEGQRGGGAEEHSGGGVEWPVVGDRWPVGGDIVLDDVYLAYEGGERPALNGFSLTIPAGKTVALVGPTGAGKSTVAYLLLRFLAPDKGRIGVGGRWLATIDPDGWRAQVAWVSQRPHLFHGSVADNLRLARPAATMAEIIIAAQAAQAHDFIEALPQGYETAIGEAGSRLSGGQRQRLAIARAYLKDAPYLILDEATANLDAASEAAVRATLQQLARGRTVLIIAHRLQMAQDADLVAVVDGGRVVEQGSHQKLLASGTRYRQLVRTYEGNAA